MKEEVKTTTTTTKIYKCDYCDMTSIYADSIECHELQQHKCSHCFEYSLDTPWRESTSIEKTCKKCKLSYSVRLENVEADQATLEKLFNSGT